MRTLRFIVDGQSIRKDTNCDFSGLVPGSEGYLQAKFSFVSRDWDDCVKAAAFYSPMGREYTPQILKDGWCQIPPEACERGSFGIRVVGKKGDFKIRTDKVIVYQDGGKT